MLAPEVWTFDPPANLLRIKEGVLDSDSSVIETTIKSHHFNHLVSVVLPDTLEVPDTIRDTLSTDGDYYSVDGLAVHELISIEFISAFVKKGFLTVLSTGTCVDLDNCLALIGSGHLILSLDRESYFQLGIEGKPTLSKNKHCQRYMVILDLTAEHFLPGRKGYDRVQQCIRDHLQSFDVILSWDSGDEKVCPSSVASYLHGRGMEIKLCKPLVGHRTEYNIKVPVLDSKKPSADVEDLLEWLGAFSLNLNRWSMSEKEFLSTYSPPEETIDCGQVAFLSWKGFFTSTQIFRLFQILRDYVQDRGDMQWASLYVQGFADSPISWNQKEHVFHTDGDSSFTVLIKPNNSFTVASLLSNYRKIK